MKPLMSVSGVEVVLAGGFYCFGYELSRRSRAWRAVRANRLSRISKRDLKTVRSMARCPAHAMSARRRV